MKKILAILILFVITSFAIAQTQQGYVKTIGRPGKPGHPLSQVQVRIKGEVNSLLTDDNGKFSFVIKHVSGSNAYIISSVRKQGYIIADNDLLTRPNPFSPSVPTVVVMVSQTDLDADRRTIENKTRQAVQNNYDQRIKELERQVKEAVISEEHYRAELVALMDWYDNLDNLVAKMAEYYARVDYDSLTEEDAEINLCIEQGFLDRADSLIDARGKITDRIIAAKSQIERGQQLQSTGANIEQEGLMQLRSAQQDAEHKYNIAMAKFDNAAALEMLKQLVQSDSTNCGYQVRLADFYRKNIIDFSKSEEIYKHAVEIASADRDTIEIISILNNHGMLLSKMGRYEESLDYYERALELQMLYNNEFSIGIAGVYNNIISHYIDVRDYSEALSRSNELLTLIDSSENKDSPAMIETRGILKHNIAGIYAQANRLDEAEQLMEENLRFTLDQYGHYSIYTYSCYNSLGWLYDRTMRSEKAIEMYNEAMDIVLTLYGSNHIEVAAVYSNISSAYENIGQNKVAWEYAEKALDIRRKLLGNMHPDVALSLHNIGTLFIGNELFDEALPYLKEAEQIREKILSEFNSSTASTYMHLGAVYSQCSSPDYELAIRYYKRAAEILEQIVGEEYETFLSLMMCAQYEIQTNDYVAAIATLNVVRDKAPLWIGSEAHDMIAVYALLRRCYMHEDEFELAFDAALDEYYQQIISDTSDSDAVMSKYGNVITIYNQIKESGQVSAGITAKYNRFMDGVIPVVIVPTSDSPAAQIGWSGTYDLVHYNDWDLASNPMEFFLYMNTQLERLKHVIVCRDCAYFTHSFEGKLGTRMGVRPITPEERDAMIKKYKKNKNKLLKTMK